MLYNSISSNQEQIQCIAYFTGKQKTINNINYFVLDLDDYTNTHNKDYNVCLIDADQESQLSRYKRCDSILVEGGILNKTNDEIILDDFLYWEHDNE
jgi:predicted O-methyltransferase YrrM